jgi:hypothetical protein
MASRAGASGRFALEIRACPVVSTEAVRRILTIEIGDLLVDAGAVAPVDSDRLALRCDRALVLNGSWMAASLGGAFC